MSIVSTLTENANEFISDLIFLQQQRGKRATGKSARSLKAIKISDKGYQIRGVAYFDNQEVGTSPLDVLNRSIPDFADVLQEWADAKNIDINPYAVARSIKFRGDRLFQKLEQPLGSVDLWQKNGRLLSAKLIDEYATIFTTTIRGRD